MAGFRDRFFRRTPGPIGKNDASDVDNPVSISAVPGPAGGSGEVNAKLREILAKVDQMIAAGRRLGYPLAAENLQHWRDGSGKLRIIPASVFSGEAFITVWLKKMVWPKFVEGTTKRLKNGSLRKNGRVEMYYESARGLYPPYGTDLYFALGGFTIRSDVVVRWVDAGDGGAIFEFVSWKCQAKDEYDWDAGKATLIPGMGRIRDDDLLALEKAGYGKAFSIESEVWEVTDPVVLQAFAVAGY
jgi:hypothetical protein